MQSDIYHNFFSIRIGLPIDLLLPKTYLTKIFMDALKMATVVFLAALATLVMGL